jgi:hypothetical protein
MSAQTIARSREFGMLRHIGVSQRQIVAMLASEGALLGLVGAAAQGGKLVNTPDCYADPRFDRSVDVQSGFHTRCSLALPLIDHKGGMVGVMQVLNKRGGVYDAADEALAEALAAQCAMALQRARMTAELIEGERLRQALELARLVQHSTLPREWPRLPGYDMHGTFMPAEQTGGDTYDLMLLPQGLLVVLGDATGHGIAPALSVLQMHAMLRTAMRLGVTLEAIFWGTPSGWASTLVVYLLLAGVQFMILGVMGEYVGRAFLSANGKPQGVVRELIAARDSERVS